MGKTRRRLQKQRSLQGIIDSLRLGNIQVSSYIKIMTDIDAMSIPRAFFKTRLLTPQSYDATSN